MPLKVAQSGREMPDAWYELFLSPLGWTALAWRKKKLFACTFGYSSQTAALQAVKKSLPLDFQMTQITSPLAKRLNQYLTGLLSSSGDKTRRRGGEKNLIFTPLKISGAHLPYPDQFLDIPIDFEGISPFGRRVLEQCRRIRPGKTKSYGELAKLAGNSGGARAVGNWMARNRVPLIIPCHRVVCADGAIGNYSAPGGGEVKRLLLSSERQFQ